MSAEPEPTSIRVVSGQPREPRESGGFKFDLDLEPLILPAIIAGGLVFTAVYKDKIAELIQKLSGIDLKLPPVQIPPIPTPTPSGGGGGTITGGSTDSNGIKIPYKMTGKTAKMAYGARHPNGDRYNTNPGNIHFDNYYVVGYYLTQGGSGKRLIEMKTDGPMHSGCTSGDKCEWVELDFDISNGQPYISSEYPHPVNHPPVTQGVTINKPSGNFINKYVGFGVAAYTDTDGFRVYEEWIDPGGLVNGKPANQWVKTLHAKNTGQIIPNPKRALPTGGSGIEAEIRMNNQHQTEMKFGAVYEITAGSANLAYAFLGERFSNV